MQKAVYIAIFINFVRKVLDKLKVEEHGDIPLYVDRGCGEYNVVVKDYGVFWTCEKRKARLVAAAIIETCPRLKGDVSIIESEDIDCDADWILQFTDGPEFYRIKRVIRDLD